MVIMMTRRNLIPALPRSDSGEAPAHRAFEGRRALVIGGSGGIGRETAFELGQLGAELVVHGGRSATRLDETLSALEEAGAKASGFLLEIEKPSDIIAEIEARGPFDILAVAFGPFVRKSLAKTTPGDWERLALLDLALPGALVSALFPGMKERGWGRILLFGGSRTDAIRAYTSNAAYAAAKTGIAVLAKSLAVEGSDCGIACIAVCPGLVETEYLDDVQKSGLEAMAPGGRLLDARAVARTALSLLAADPCIASGSVFTLDAGLNPRTSV